MDFINIKVEMTRNGYSQESLAIVLGVTQKTISNWFYKKNVPSTKLVEMSKLFDCSIDYLLGLKDDRKVS